VSAQSAIQQVLAYPAYSNGMEDAVVDLVVIQWIMQKLRVDRIRSLSEHSINPTRNCRAEHDSGTDY